jgi:broad specificity phosphatase PhoE
MINIVITSNSETEHDDYLFGRIKEKDFKDSELSSKGKNIINEKKIKIFEKNGNKTDIVFVSPYTRCIQTCLETYKDLDTIPSIYAICLLSESLDTPLTQGTNKDILEKTYLDVDFNEVFFEKIESNNKEWFNFDSRKNLTNRVKLFEMFLIENKDELMNKKIHVITHSDFIEKIINKPVEYYQSFSLGFDTKKGIWTPSWRSIRAI